VAGHLKSTQCELAQKMANVKGICGGIEAHIHTNRASTEARFKSYGIGGIMDESTCTEFAQKARICHASMLP
jgi:hypothetical protein